MMRRGGFPIGKIFGIPISVDLSFILIVALLTFLLGDQILPRMIDPDPSQQTLWGLALAGSLIFFVSLLLHELAHSVVARAFGMEVTGITLFMLGGVSMMKEDSRNAREEFLIAVVGPLTSAILGAAFLAIVFGLGYNDSSAAAVVLWLGTINLFLAAFNMLPGFPLDGGRVFRSAIWGLTGSRTRATRIASRAGQGLGILLIGYGVVGFFIDIGGGVGGLWAAVIGWFLFAQAAQARRGAEAEDNLAKLRVRELMLSSDDLRTVDADLPIRFLAPNREQLDHRLAFLATESDAVVGIVPAAAILLLDEERYQADRLRTVMLRADSIEPISPDASGEEALQRLQDEQGSVIPVVDDGRLLGLVGLDQLMLALRRQAAPQTGA